jgi:hypothetical protein
LQRLRAVLLNYEKLLPWDAAAGTVAAASARVRYGRGEPRGRAQWRSFDEAFFCDDGLCVRERGGGLKHHALL